MVEEKPEDDDRFEKRAGKLSHDLVDRVLSKISELEEKEALPEETSPEAQVEVSRRPGRPLKKRINFLVKIFSILVILFFGGWYLLTKRGPLKTWLGDQFSTLSSKVVTEKDSVWIRRKVPGLLKEKEIPFAEEQIGEDVKGIPVYIGAKRTNVSTQDNVSTVNFITSDPIDRVVTFYIKEMERKGYGLVKADYWPGAEVGQLLFSMDGKECTISLVENQIGGVNVAISYME